MRLEPNTRLGPYEIVTLIGSGGMGEVYRARDTRLNRLVAVKVLRLGADDTSDRQRRFLVEAQAASALNHPNIVVVHDIGSERLVSVSDNDTSIHYMAMELVDGRPLSHLIPPQGMPLRRMLSIGLQIADALAAAHASRIVHRDLKPANVVVTSDDRVKLLDFGVARMLAETDVDVTRTAAGTVIGTYPYMSPEQLRGASADARSDIFAFGAVLYEMASGQRAFPGDAAPEVAAAILHGNPPHLTNVPLGVVHVIERCLQKNPEERFARGIDVKTALERVLNPLEAKPSDDPSIAVLPFANLSADKENEYFSDGLAEDILDALTRVHGLKVIARTSSFAFRRRDQDIRAIAATLGIRNVLEGSVRRAGSRIRVTAQLVDGVDGAQLWSERYDREVTDVFAVQDEISQAIVGTLKLKLTAGTSLVSRETSSVEAYHAYLKGRHHFLKLTPEEVARGRVCFEEAINLDPTYAAAFASVARALHAAAFFGWKPPREAMPLAKTAALKAVSLDQAEPEAQFVLAAVAGQYDYDWEEALRRCRVALACPAVPSDVRSVCAGFVLLTLERYEEALAALEHALATDPLSPIPQHQLAGALAFRGDHERAREALERLVDLHPAFWPAYQFLGCEYLALEKMPEAIAAFERGIQLLPSYPSLVGLLAGCYARTGDMARAEQLLSPVAVSEGQVGTAMGLALFHMIISNFDEAAHHYARGIDERDVSAPSLGPLIANERFRRSPQGRAILQKMNLTHLAR